MMWTVPVIWHFHSCNHMGFHMAQNLSFWFCSLERNKVGTWFHFTMQCQKQEGKNHEQAVHSVTGLGLYRMATWIHELTNESMPNARQSKDCLLHLVKKKEDCLLQSLWSTSNRIHIQKIKKMSQGLHFLWCFICCREDYILWICIVGLLPS